MPEIFSKYGDIDAVMQKAAVTLNNVEREYQTCLKEEKIPDSLLVEVKDCISNLRSVLDYLWHKIPGATNGHFPVANSEADFKNKVIGLDAKYVAVLSKHQSYDVGGWIRRFNLFRNKNEHFTLVPQKRKETPQFTVKANGSSATFSGCTFGAGCGVVAIGGVPLSFDGKTQFPYDADGAEIERIVWIDFLFDGRSISPDFPEGISALPFLKSSFENVKNIVLDIESLI